MELQKQDTIAALTACDMIALPADQRLMRWRAYARQRRADILDTSKVRLLEQAGVRGLSAEALYKGLRWQFGPGLIHDLCQDYGAWRGEKVVAINPEELTVIDAAVGEGLRHLIPTDAGVTSSYTGSRLYRWMIPSLGGGLLGVVLLLVADDVSRVWGALIGGAGGVAGVAWLANHPEAMAQPNRSVGSDRATPTPVSAFPPLAWLQGIGHWLLHRTQRLAWLQGIGHWLLSNAQGVARWLAARLVALVLPPPPVATAILPSSTIAPVCERTFDLLTILVFIFRVTQADSNTPTNRDNSDLPITEDSVLRAMLALVRTLERQPAEIETVHDLAEELHQRMEDAGYVWEVLPDGTLFQEEHRQRFHAFGLVTAGEPVETLEPCFRRGDAILLPGRITKQRG